MSSYEYFTNGLYILDSTNITNLTTASLVLYGGLAVNLDTNINGNLTVGGDVLTTLGTPANVRALGYQVFTNITTSATITSGTIYYTGLSFSVTSANYGTYLIEFTATISTSNTATFIMKLH